MNTLFTATLIVQGQPVAYDVTFEEDHYTFQSQVEEVTPSSFIACMEHDEWKVKGAVNAIMKQQALEQLQDYLLQQH